MKVAGSLVLVPNLLGAGAPEDVLPARTLASARAIEHWVVETPKAARAFLKAIAHPRPIASLSIAALPERPDAATLATLLAPRVKVTRSACYPMQALQPSPIRGRRSSPPRTPRASRSSRSSGPRRSCSR
jgi:hypothetical protein